VVGASIIPSSLLPSLRWLLLTRALGLLRLNAASDAATKRAESGQAT
jgi:hypothetical protein